MLGLSGMIRAWLCSVPACQSAKFAQQTSTTNLKPNSVPPSSASLPLLPSYSRQPTRSYSQITDPPCDDMAPSPKPANKIKKFPFSRFQFIAFILGCSFFLVLWHRVGRSDNLGFDNDLLHKNIKVHHRSSDPLSVCIHLNFNRPSNSNLPSI